MQIINKDNVSNIVYKTPIEQRCKRSKFNNMIVNFTDEQLKALIYCLIFDKQVKNAIDCYSKSVSHEVQLYCLQKEYDKRFKNEKNNLHVREIEKCK